MKMFRKILKKTGIVLFVISLLVVYSCHAQKQYKSVPCPCEKNKR